MKEKTITTLYGTFVSLMVLALGIGYANVVTELKIEGKTEGEEQYGVYITEVEYLTNSGADTTNSKVNFFKGTMLDSNIILGSSTSSTITYQVTIKNNTDREQVFIGIIKDETNEEAYNNTNIQPKVETVEGVTGLEEYVSTVAPGEYITFPVTYAYAGTDTSNPELQGKINFRFREVPILELSNEGEIYTLENITAGHEEEYEFTVSNYNQNYTNGVPMTYTFETTLTEGNPLEAKIYDSEGNEVTETITIPGDGTNADHTYTLKLIWDSSLDSTEYEGQSYTCTVKLTAVPDTIVDADLADYADYKIEQGFEIEITTCSHTWENGVCTICGKICEHEEYGDWETVTEATCGAEGLEKRTCSICKNEETQSIAATGIHTYGSWVTTTNPTCVDTGGQTKTCSICGDKQTQEIAATGEHTYGDWVVIKSATCAATGTRTKTCTICGVTESETIAKLTTHTYGSWVTTTAATCTTAGSKYRTCSVCGAKETQTIAATGKHTYSFYETWSEADNGTYITYYCKVCSQHTTAYMTKAASSYQTNISCNYCGGIVNGYATWWEDGTITVMCSNCTVWDDYHGVYHEVGYVAISSVLPVGLEGAEYQFISEW